jgi:hypothetical protein
MSRIRNALATGAILLGSSAALLTGGIAKADPLPAPAPVPAPAPAAQGLGALTQLINPANAPQLLQMAASMFTPKPATTAVSPAAYPAAVAAPLAPAALAPPAAPAPLATASLNLPQSPITPAAVQPPVLGNSGDLPASALPAGELNIPNLPGLPVPLPEHLSFPGDLTALIPGAPAAAPSQGITTPTAAANSPMPAIGALFPAYALP